MLGKIKTKQEKTGEIVAYSEAALVNNSAIVEYCKISMAALSGGTAGLLGLTGLYGFGFYIFAVLGLWAMLLMKVGSQWRKYFISRRGLLTGGFFGGLCLFCDCKFYRHMYYSGHFYMEWYMFIRKKSTDSLKEITCNNYTPTYSIYIIVDTDQTTINKKRFLNA